MREEVEHATLPDLLHKYPEQAFRLTCGMLRFVHLCVSLTAPPDRCDTSIFSASFLCTLCGYDVCLGCNRQNEINLPELMRACPHTGTLMIDPNDVHYQRVPGLGMANMRTGQSLAFRKKTRRRLSLRWERSRTSCRPDRMAKQSSYLNRSANVSTR